MAEPRASSLRRRLLVLLLTAVSTAWLIAAVVSFVDARHELSEVLDAELAQTASLVMAEWNTGATGAGQDAIETEHAPVLHRYGVRVAFQVWQDGTELRLHSRNAPDTPLSAITDGFSDVEIGGIRWRVFSAWQSRPASLVQVAEQSRDRDELTTAVARNLALPLVIAFPLLGFLIWGAVGRAVQSLTHVSQDVASRDPDNLSPIAAGGAPSEIGALVASLNALFGRIRAMVERERRFTADAAHELRTPLAGIRAQAQVARSAVDDDERTRALDGVMAGADRAAHAVDQMLTLARLAPDAVAFESSALDVVPVLERVIGDLAPAALNRRVDVGLTDRAGTAAIVDGNGSLLAILFRNLIDNAIRYSPSDTVVDVAVESTPSGVRVVVSDAGPGITMEQRANIGRRFYRPPGTAAPGTGLGLSIAQRIVDLHGGTLRVDTPASGIGWHVTTVLPRAR